MVHGQVALLEYRCQFKLVGSYLVVARLAGYAQFQSLYLKVFHKGLHAFGYGSEIVVIHLLVFGRVVPHECASGKHEVGSGEIKVFVHQKIFLFPTKIGLHFFYLWIEQLGHIGGRLVHGAQRT